LEYLGIEEIAYSIQIVFVKKLTTGITNEIARRDSSVGSIILSEFLIRKK